MRFCTKIWPLIEVDFNFKLSWGVFDKKFTEISPLSRMFSKNASGGPGLVDGREGNRL